MIFMLEILPGYAARSQELISHDLCRNPDDSKRVIKRLTRQPVRARGDEVARSVLGARVPRGIRGQIPARYSITAWLPFAICMLLAAGYATAFPEVELVWLRVLYLALGGGVWSALLLVRNHYARVSDSMSREYRYAREELMPALHFCGALVTVSDTIRLMKGEEVEVAHSTNLYDATSLRLVKEGDGSSALTFLFR